MRVLTFEKITYIGSMDWKEKMKWKILIILAALVGILIVWCAGKAGENSSTAESEILKEYVLKENEWASAAEAVSSLKDRLVELAEDTAEEAAATVKTAVQKEETVQEADQELPISVLIMDNGFNSYYHDKITIEFQGSCQGSGGETYQPGEVLDLLDIRDVYVCGIATEFCVKATCLDLLKAGFNVHLLSGALAYVDQDGHRKALDEIRAAGAEIL